MVGNGVSFNPRPILNLNYLLLSMASTEQTLCTLYLINPRRDPKSSSFQRLIIKSSVQTMICPEQAAHFLCRESENVTLFFKSSSCCGPPFIFDLWPPMQLITNRTSLKIFWVCGSCGESPLSVFSLGGHTPHPHKLRSSQVSKIQPVRFVWKFLVEEHGKHVFKKQQQQQKPSGFVLITQTRK